MSKPLRNPLAHPAKWALTLTAAFVLSTGASAHVISMSGVNVEIYDRTDQRALPIHEKDGQRWIVGTPGHEYSVRLHNASGGRVLAVGSVDGVNFVTGETASPSQSGYVLAPREDLEVTGWRKDLSRTASFYFTSLPDAYATRTGRPDNVGVIGVAVFRERRIRIAQPPAQSFNDEARKSAALPAPSSEAPRAERSAADAAGAAAPAPSLGTGHGRVEDSPAYRVTFVRESSTPNEVITIRYDRRDNLLAMGVLPPPPIARWADPFPQARSGFVPDPPR
jgi:hypothetical protein